MRNNTTIQYQLLIALILLAGLGACNKLLEVSPPPGEVSIDRAFNDSATAISAIYGIYNGMQTHSFFEWCGLSYITARSADEVVYDLSDDLFARNTLLYTDADIKNMWEQGFRSLSMINACLKGLQPTTSLSTTLYRQLLGETLFCRAFVNLYLINLWGDAIPLINTPDVDGNQFAKSVPRQQVYDQIIADLLRAQQLLTNLNSNVGKTRAGLMAVNALLARVYLYLGRYNDAITQANTVIGSNQYSPLPAPGTVFWASGRETIWGLATPRNTNATIEPVGDTKIYLGTVNRLTPQLLSAFEPGDLRRQTWVVDNTINGTTYTTAYKYKKTSGANLQPEYYVILRLAEQYLIRAEAYARLGQTQAAIADLNVVRTRAGLPDLSVSLTQQQCITAMEQERRVELFTEWGHRWLDLKRWPGISNPHLTRADEVLGAIKSDWQPTDQWYPVPRSELQVNAFLVQNPGYPAQ